MKLNRKTLRKMILAEIQQNMPRPSKNDFVIAAHHIGNSLQGMGMPEDPQAISQYFLRLINADHQALQYHRAEIHDDTHYEIMNRVPNPGRHGRKTMPMGNQIMNALRELGLTYQNTRYKMPGERPKESKLMYDLNAFASEVADNIASRRNS